MKEMNIPVGVSDFEEIRKNGYYYIDKSGLIGELLSRTGTKVTLITRPRRFGKTLGMSMLESFFDIRKDSRKLFEGLEIAKNQVLCDAWMNRYPTAFVSFRQVDGLDFTGAYDMLTWVVSELSKRHLYLLDSDKIDNTDKDIAKQLARGNASLKDTKGSLMLLTRMMQQHYGKPVILLILSAVHPFAVGWISDFSGWFCGVIRFFLFRLHFFALCRLTLPIHLRSPRRK